MRQFLLGLLGVLACAGIAGATPACTIGPISVDPSTSFACGGLDFSDFSVMAAAPGTVPTVTLVSSQATNDDVVLLFNPALNGATGHQDLFLYFTISGGPIADLHVTVGGTGATVEETACSAPTVNNVCTEGTRIANFAGFSPPNGTATAGLEKPIIGTTYVFQDIGVESGGSLESFTDRFQISSGGESKVPEPASILLIGGGVLAFCFVRRKLWPRMDTNKHE